VDDEYAVTADAQSDEVFGDRFCEGHLARSRRSVRSLHCSPASLRNTPSVSERFELLERFIERHGRDLTEMGFETVFDATRRRLARP
jgi:hypothetical protein